MVLQDRTRPSVNKAVGLYTLWVQLFGFGLIK
jgi:hypothetical protein